MKAPPLLPAAVAHFLPPPIMPATTPMDIRPSYCATGKWPVPTTERETGMAVAPPKAFFHNLRGPTGNRKGHMDEDPGPLQSKKKGGK